MHSTYSGFYPINYPPEMFNETIYSYTTMSLNVCSNSSGSNELRRFSLKPLDSVSSALDVDRKLNDFHGERHDHQEEKNTSVRRGYLNRHTIIPEDHRIW